MRKKLLELFGVGGSKVFPTITKVDPFVPKNKKEILQRDLKLSTQKRKASEAKLDNTIFRIEQQKEKLLGKEFKKGKDLVKKAKGGRVGLKAGTNPFMKKSNIKKIQETFGPKKNKKRINAKGGKLIGGQKNIDVAAPFGKITGEDFAKLRSKKTKKKVI
tara:strand:+ start:43 stop:522 length:480 start_codon:yes stop_codon:yes gene_type:complete